jgi:hypothetical protein
LDCFNHMNYSFTDVILLLTWLSWL